jgi:ABC-2 type transport system ATP-binding protein
VVLAATGLVKRYGQVVALDGCSLGVERGRMLGFLGPNGAGKTTAMRAVFGLVSLDGGEVTWDGAPVGRHERVRFGYMPEQRGLYPKMRVADQLAHLARLHGADKGAAGESARRWLDQLGLGDRAEDALENLSHGNQQRVQLIAALVHEPELLVLDEPFSGLDPLGVEAMEEVLRQQAGEGVAIVFSSHQLDLVQALCDDVVVIAGGRTILSGTLAELRSASGHRRVEVLFADGAVWEPSRDLPGVEVVEASGGRLRLLVPDSTDPEQVLASARATGPVEQFTFEPPTLSDLFVEAVRR